MKPAELAGTVQASPKLHLDSSSTLVPFSLRLNHLIDWTFSWTLLDGDTNIYKHGLS